jgi:hypothetical protein
VLVGSTEASTSTIPAVSPPRPDRIGHLQPREAPDAVVDILGHLSWSIAPHETSWRPLRGSKPDTCHEHLPHDGDSRRISSSKQSSRSTIRSASLAERTVRGNGPD